MKITLVSHASFLVEIDGIQIICDPWLKGKVFNNGWALLARAMDISFDKVDYIYLSHEHPDHFNLPSLKSIDEKYRKKIKILYQKHASSRIKDACYKLGFGEFIEMPLYRWMPLTKNINLYCGSVGSMDSFLAINDNRSTVLNLNDCVLNHKHYLYILNKIGPIDVLFTQFSFADWVGNYHDERGEAEAKLKDVKEQIEILQPKITVPFASYVYFCNNENQRMNAWANTPKKIYERIPELSVMYPGDTFNIDNPVFNSNYAVERFMNDYNSMVIDHTPEAKTQEEISEAIEKTFSDFNNKTIGILKKIIEPLTFYIHDLDLYLTVDIKNSKYVFSQNPIKYRYQICSQVCWFTFNFTWGGNTLQVSGMYIDRDFPEKNSEFFRIQNLLSTEYFSIKSFSKFKNSICFIWSKRFEIYYRIFNR